MAPADSSDRAPQEGMKFNVVPPSTRSPCAFCFQLVDQAVRRTCPRCQATYHPDCFKANDDRCTIYGCEPLVPSAAPAPVAAPVRRGRPVPAFGSRRLGLNWAFIGIVGMVVAQAALRLTHHPSGAPPPSVQSRGSWYPIYHPSEGKEDLIRARVVYQATLPFLRSLDEREGLPEDFQSRENLLQEVQGALQRLRWAQFLYQRGIAAGPPTTDTIDAVVLAEKIRKLEMLSAQLSRR